jgi:hypothetical protein
VVQVVAPDPADHVPVTTTSETGFVPSVTAIVTVAVQFRPPELAAELMSPTHIGVSGGGGEALQA